MKSRRKPVLWSNNEPQLCLSCVPDGKIQWELHGESRNEVSQEVSELIKAISRSAKNIKDDYRTMSDRSGWNRKVRKWFNQVDAI